MAAKKQIKRKNSNSKWKSTQKRKQKINQKGKVNKFENIKRKLYAGFLSLKKFLFLPFLFSVLKCKSALAASLFLAALLFFSSLKKLKNKKEFFKEQRKRPIRHVTSANKSHANPLVFIVLCVRRYGNDDNNIGG